MSKRMKRVGLWLLICAALMLTGCGSGSVNKAEIEALNARIAEAEALYDAGDFFGAAKGLDAILVDYRQRKAGLDYKAAMALREQTLLPLYAWMGVTENTWRGGEDDASRFVGNPVWASAIIQETYQRDADKKTKTSYVTSGLDSALEIACRNSLYQYYRQAMDAGEDIYALDALAYAHDDAWAEFSKALYKKYPVELPDDFTWKGGKKLLITDGEKQYGKWAEKVLDGVSAADLATNADEAGYVLRIDEEWVQLNASWVHKDSGNVVKQYYRSDITIALKDLSTGEEHELYTCSKQPSQTSMMNFNSYNVGKHADKDIQEAVREHVFPALEGIVHVFADS